MSWEASERPTYERSGRVSWLRFAPATLATLFVTAGMAWCWCLAWDAGRGVWLFTPLVLVLPVALAGYLAVALGHCRNRWVAGALALLAATVYYAGFFHARLVHQLGPAALTRLDLLPRFVAEQVAINGIFPQNWPLPPSEAWGWLAAAVELAVIAFVLLMAAVYRSQRAYCESCHRWMRSILLNAEPGTSRDVADALDADDWSAVPVIVGWGAKFGQPASMLEFEYCPGVREPSGACAAYLTLQEFVSLKEQAKVLLRQGRLEPQELDDLADHVAALAWLRVSAPYERHDRQDEGRDAGPLRAGASALAPRPAAASFATMQRLAPAAGAVGFNRIEAIELLLGILCLCATIAGLGMMVWGGLLAPWDDMPADAWPGWLLLATGFAVTLAAGLVCWINVDYLGLRYAYRRIRDVIAQRPDALLTGDDPGARFVDIVPRSQWHRLPADKAADRGLLVVDRSRRRLLFEGVKERYHIPADAVLGCTVEPMIPNTESWNFYAVVLTVRYPVGAATSIVGGRRDDAWEIPLVRRPTEFRRYGTNYRRTLAETLRAEIETLLPPSSVD